jgi:hypothetical protein
MTNAMVARWHALRISAWLLEIRKVIRKCGDFFCAGFWLISGSDVRVINYTVCRALDNFLNPRSMSLPVCYC